jgi:hypothetical protein
MSKTLPLKVTRGVNSIGLKLRHGYWKKAMPFVENSRAKLIHRPASVNEHINCKMRHISIHYYCGATATGLENFTFLEAPPDGALVCAVCEARAVMAGLPAAKEIAGRHVHIGRMKPVMTCVHGTGEDTAL